MKIKIFVVKQIFLRVKIEIFVDEHETWWLKLKIAIFRRFWLTIKSAF